MMSLSVGVICEGSHDFNVLRRFLAAIAKSHGVVLGNVDCLQPTVSATFQKSTGGWSQVKAWCEAEVGEGYRKHFDQPLFLTSKTYDLLVIHLDGDVVQHCAAAPVAGADINGMTVDQVVDLLTSAIKDHWLKLDHSHIDRVISCIPVRHLEAWLAAGTGLHIQDSELRPTKDEFRAGPIRKGRASWRDKYIRAADQAVKHLPEIRAKCVSFNRFETDFAGAIAP